MMVNKLESFDNIGVGKIDLCELGFFEMKILVTGADGFIGSYLTETLVR